MSSNNSGGYQVDTGKIHNAGQAAVQIGEAVAALANDVDLGCTISTAPEGLDIGSALVAIDPLWQQHFQAVGAELQRVGNTLCGISANYSANETRTSAAFHGIMS